ncbi:MAG: hypothetical protein ACREUC_19495 [Steroidobacteraceae bacterium]
MPFLKADNAHPAALFGRRLSMSQNGQTLAIGAIHDSSSGLLAAGAAYVFVRGGVSWRESADVRAGNPDMMDAFGHVTLLPTGSALLVGAPLEAGNASSTEQAPNNRAPKAGAAYEY